MLTLGQASSLTKTFAKWTAGIVGAIFLVIIIIKVGTAVKEIISPTPPAPPTVIFGKLSSIEFPPNNTGVRYSYTVDTLTGSLPVFSDRAKVFKMVPDRADLLALQKAQNKVSKVGFTSKGILVSENIYEWTDEEPLLRKLTLNTLTSNFTLTSTFLTDPTILSGSQIPDKNGAISLAQSFLSSMSSLPADIDSSKTKSTLFSIKNGTLVPATSFADTQIIRVDLFQKDIDKISIYYSNPIIPNISLLIGGKEDENKSQIVQVNYTYQGLTEENATYPIKTADEAFSQLQEGKAFIASNSSNTNISNISIRNVLLGYYMGKNRQDYLLPIVVFEGDNNFIAYVSAVKDEWISN